MKPGFRKIVVKEITALFAALLIAAKTEIYITTVP